MMAKTKKRPTPAQIAARKLFAERARAGAFAKKAKSKGRSAKRPTARKKPASPAQLRARAAFVKMVKARAAAARKKNGVMLTGKQKSVKARKSANPKRHPLDWNKPKKESKRQKRTRRMSSALITRTAYGKKYPRRTGPGRLPNPVRFKTEKEFEAWKAKTGTATRRRSSVVGRRKKRGGGVAGTLKSLGRSVVRGLGVMANPKRAKDKARMAKGQRNPTYRIGSGTTLWTPQRGKGYKKRRQKLPRVTGAFGTIKVTRTEAAKQIKGIRKQAKQAGFRFSPSGRIIESKNPSPASVFSEFRGKGATTKSKAKAAKGTPPVLAKLGQLRELRLRGRSIKFGGSAALAADGRKKLHVVGVQMKRPNPPGEIDYGEVISVTYRADKPHIEEGTFDYVHKFGEEGGRRPHLIVDEEGMPVLEGGSYKISEDGIID